MSGKTSGDQGLPPYLTRLGPGAWRLLVWVQPGAKKSAVAGLYQDRLKIRIEAPAVDNKANAALVDYVARTLGLKKSQVSLSAGKTTRGKTLVIETENEPSWAAMAPEPTGR